MVSAFFAPLALLTAIPALAQGPRPSLETISPPVRTGVIALPVAAGVPDREVWYKNHDRIDVRNVTRPTLEPFLPEKPVTTSAVIVAPGGGFLGLSMENEGWNVAKWLQANGIPAFVLKYRVVPTPAPQAEFADKMARAMRGEAVDMAPPADTPAQALADAQAAMRYLQANAARYRIDAQHIGFMGFSAGGFLARSLVEAGGETMPAFVAPIYPKMGPMKVPADAPPMFVAVAADDMLLNRERGFPLIEDYRTAGRSVEFHLFASGRHGFGAGRPGTPTENWLDLFMRWLRTQNLLGTVN
ncbi:alpha/beta hydrolase [Sphingomonas sp.]|uniref:alpha/beta hydrolase n=1 Tax=Sphingomonas sp. TaxID=28214 RepID=UPI001EB49CEB|nr:alpha/beta hydrolase [Sphingomonas sp.]MBX3592854.1 alpha/beta hydrolase [Sphingomonas sp.]